MGRYFRTYSLKKLLSRRFFSFAQRALLRQVCTQIRPFRAFLRQVYFPRHLPYSLSTSISYASNPAFSICAIWPAPSHQALPCEINIACLTGAEGNHQRAPTGIGHEVDLGRGATTRTPDALFPPPFSASCGAMRAHDRAVDNDPFRELFICQGGKHGFPGALLRPTTKRIVKRASGAIFLRCRTPRGTGQQYMNNAADHLAIINTPETPLDSGRYGLIRSHCASKSQTKSDTCQSLPPRINSGRESHQTKSAYHFIETRP